jgi:hypothetical protein
LSDTSQQPAYPEESLAFFIERCIEHHKMPDLATALSHASRSKGMDTLLRLSEAGAWEDIAELIRFYRAIKNNVELPFDAVIAKKIQGESLKLQQFIVNDNLENLEFPAAHCATKILFRHPEFKHTHAQLQQLFTIRQKLIERISSLQKEQQHPKLKASLICLARLPGPVHHVERFWSQLRQAPPNWRSQYWISKSQDERCMSLAENLFMAKQIPKAIVQRRDLAAWLFHRIHWSNTPNLPKNIVDAYRDGLEKAIRLAEACNLDLLRTQDVEKAKKIMGQLQWVQCLLPPQAIIDFSTAYFEFRFLPPPEDDENRIKVLLQTEVQIPDAGTWLCTSAQFRNQLLPYLQGLSKRIIQTKAQYYLSDGRPGRALSSLLIALELRWAWGEEMILEKAEEILAQIQEIADDDQCYLTSLGLSQMKNSNPSIALYIENSASTRIGLSAKFVEEESHVNIFPGMSQLFRALQVGFPFKDAKNLLQQFESKVEEAKKERLQMLSLQVGSALGEALSTRSLSSDKASAAGKSEVGNHLQQLYESFRDVMLQQDPFAQETQRALQDILSQTNVLIEEAKSIENQQTTSVLDDIKTGLDKEGKRLLLDDPQSIRELVQELYLSGSIEGEAEEEGEGAKRRIPPEQVLISQYYTLITHLCTRQITVKNNPLLQHLGAPLMHWINKGWPDCEWWEDMPILPKAQELFPPLEAIAGEGIVKNDRYVICRVYEWLRFENEEALKVPYRKSMSIVCSHITNGIVSTRELAQKHFSALIAQLKPHDKNGQLIPIVEAMRKASSQISSLEVMKKNGILPVKFDRSIEPRVRAFLETCTRNLISFGAPIYKKVQADLPRVYAYDRAEFMLGAILGEKEKALKRYLHMNLDELTQSYLRSSNKNSLQSKIANACIRVQQGINFRRSDSRNLRYSPVVTEKDYQHTPKSIEAHLQAFEEMFPIIDRISGSRQTINESELAFKPDEQGKTAETIANYREIVDCYLDNSLKLARQLRILIIPGQGTGNYDNTSHSLCIPLHTGSGRTSEMTILSALADYLYHTKVSNESAEIEDEILNILNKKNRSTLKSGSHDAKLKVTQLLYQELGALAGQDKMGKNPGNISSLLGQAILGTDQTMIYRDLRELSAPQKQQRYKSLQVRYFCEKKNIPLAERVAEVCVAYISDETISSEQKKQYPERVFHRLSESCRQLIRDELYDLGVLQYHYGAINEAYSTFEFIIKVAADFPEAYWGLGTTARHGELNVISAMQKQSTTIGAYKQFSSFAQVGPFWRKRAADLNKKISANLTSI